MSLWQSNAYKKAVCSLGVSGALMVLAAFLVLAALSLLIGRGV